MTLRSLRPLVALALIGGALAPAHAQFLTPASYSYGASIPQNPYIDNTGTQLTDGIIGANNFGADLGNGAAYEWVAWQQANPIITFTFSSTVNISQIQFGFNRNDANAILIPHTATINGVANSLNVAALPAGASRGFLNVNQNITSDTVTIQLLDTDHLDWIFVDEIRFVQGTAAAPEPGTLALLAIGGTLVLAKRRRK